MANGELLVIDDAPAKEALTWPEKANGLAVITNEVYTVAADMLKNIKALRQLIADTFDPHVQRAHQAHKALVAEKAKAEAPLTEAEAVIKRKMVTYSTEQERIRREAEEQARAAALKAEEDRRLAEASALAALATATGDESYAAEAEAIIQAPIEAPAVTVKSTMPVAAGISYRETWAAVVTSKARLIEFVAANPDYLNLLDVNATAVNALARALKGTMKIPGLQAQATKTVASRAS